MGKRRVSFYIDGFNFYYGFKRTCEVDRRWLQFYWLDIVKLCAAFLPPDQVLERVVYFTASPLDPQAASRQGAFLNANKFANPNTFEIVRGKYLKKVITCPACKYAITRPEEKKTDVNISIRMLEDCMKKLTDKVVLVSADSDLIPPLSAIRRNFPEIGISVYFPPANNSGDIRNLMSSLGKKVVFMSNNYSRFKNAIMPDTITVQGSTAHIPAEWKAKQKSGANAEKSLQQGQAPVTQ